MVVVVMVMLVMCQLVGKSLPNGRLKSRTAPTSEKPKAKGRKTKEEQAETKEMRRRSQVCLLGLLRFASSALLAALDISPMMLLLLLVSAGVGGEIAVNWT